MVRNKMIGITKVASAIITVPTPWNMALEHGIDGAARDWSVSEVD